MDQHQNLHIYHVRDAHPDAIPDMNIQISFPILYVLKHQTILVWTGTRTAVTGEPVRFDPSVSIASCAPDDVAFEWIRRTSNHKDTLGTVKIAVGGLNEVWQNIAGNSTGSSSVLLISRYLMII